MLGHVSYQCRKPIRVVPQVKCGYCHCYLTLGWPRTHYVDGTRRPLDKPPRGLDKPLQVRTPLDKPLRSQAPSEFGKIWPILLPSSEAIWPDPERFGRRPTFIKLFLVRVQNIFWNCVYFQKPRWQTKFSKCYFWKVFALISGFSENVIWSDLGRCLYY